MRRPCSVSSSSRSASSFIRIAVDDMASVAPSRNAADSGSGRNRPAAQPAAVTRTIVSTTCPRPSPKTRLRMLFSLGSENSSPIENIRNTTPNSAR